MSGGPLGGQRPAEIQAWILDALRRVPMPEAPVHRPWVFAPSALVAPHLPGPLARVPGLLDRFGAIRLSPIDVGIDVARPVPWRDVIEVRTRPLLDLLTESSSSSVAALGARLLPPVPLVAKALTRAGAAMAAEAMRALVQAAAAAHAERASVAHLPAVIVYRSGRRGRRTMDAGLFSSAVLALPMVTESVLATARCHGVAIRPMAGAGRLEQRHRRPAEVGYQRVALPRPPDPRTLQRGPT